MGAHLSTSNKSGLGIPEGSVCHIFNRPGVAGADLQTPLLLIYLSEWESQPIPPNLYNIIIPKL